MRGWWVRTSRTAAPIMGLAAAMALVAVVASVWISAPLALSTSSPQVRTSLPVSALGVDGSTVGYALAKCGELRVWSIPTGGVTRVPGPKAYCDSAGVPYERVAVADDRVVWSALYETNHLFAEVYVARTVLPRAPSRLYSSDEEGGIGALAADGDVVAFSTQTGGEYGAGYAATLWVGDTRRPRPVRRARGWMGSLDVENDLVAVGYRDDGRVEVFSAKGKSLRSFRSGTADRGLALTGRQLVGLTGRVVTARSITTGRIIRAREIARPNADVELLDARAELVAYRSASQLRLLRLTDGRDIRIAAPAGSPASIHARFGKPGLVVAYPGIVKLFTWVELERLLAG